jgi:hypothetical protein
MVKRRHKGVYGPEDSFYATELLMKKISKAYGVKRQRNPYFKTLLKLEHQTKMRHSEIERISRFMDKFKKTNYLDTPLKKIRRKLKRV